MARRRSESGVSPGDPSGTRLERRRHALLSEAALLGKSFRRLLEASGEPTLECDALLDRLTSSEQAALMRMHGRVEPRRRFRHRSGTPFHEGRPTNLLYADESGRSERYRGAGAPVFTLAAVALSPAAASDYVRAANELKVHFFGTSSITLHEPDIRNRERRFFLAGDGVRQTEFDDALRRIIAETPFTAFGVAVRKDAFQDEFSDSGLDPYLPSDAYAIAIQLLMERYVDFLAHHPGVPMGRVAFESIGPKEDAIHERDYVAVLLEGTQWVSEASFRNFLETGLVFFRKGGSSPSELADMLARDLFEWTRDGCTGDPGRWSLFKTKVYRRGDGLMGKYGVKVFPDSDIRDLVEADRRA